MIRKSTDVSEQSGDHHETNEEYQKSKRCCQIIVIFHTDFRILLLQGVISTLNHPDILSEKSILFTNQFDRFIELMDTISCRVSALGVEPPRLRAILKHAMASSSEDVLRAFARRPSVLFILELFLSWIGYSYYIDGLGWWQQVYK